VHLKCKKVKGQRSKILSCPESHHFLLVRTIGSGKRVSLQVRYSIGPVGPSAQLVGDAGLGEMTSDSVLYRDCKKCIMALMNEWLFHCFTMQSL